MEKRSSGVYRKKIKTEHSNYYGSPKENNISNHLNYHNQKNISNITNQSYNKNTLYPKMIKNNISLMYSRDFPFYQINGKYSSQNPNNNKNIQEKIILGLFKKNNSINDNYKYNNKIFYNNINKTNYNNYISDTLKLNTESNYTENNYETINNINTLTRHGDKSDLNTINPKNEGTHDSLNSNDIFSKRMKRIDSKDSSSNNLNNSVFIKKKTKDCCLRNNSATHRNHFKIPSNNEPVNQNNDFYINYKPELKILKNENNRTINNSNININISINNNYLTEENNNNNNNNIEKNSYDVNKLKLKNSIINNTNNNNIKMIVIKRHNKKLIKDHLEKTKLGKISYNKLNNNKINNNKINNNIYDNLINTKLYNLEDFLLIIQKFEMIKEKFKYLSNNINKLSSKQLLEYTNKIRVKLYDIYKFYMSCSIEGSPENLFSSLISKNCLHYYSVVLLISVGLCYVITQKIKTTIDYHGKLLILLNLQEKAFMIFCDAIIKKLNKNYEQNIWVIEIIKKLNNQLISNADTVNHILQIKILSTDSYRIINDILINIYIFDEKTKTNEQEIFLYHNYYKKDFNYLTHFNINELEEIFDKNIYKAVNLRSNYANITSLKFSNKDHLDKNYKKQNSKNIFRKNDKISYLNFPPKKNYTLVLDLDETLISFKFTQINKGIGKLHLRPGLEDFLEEIKKYYEIIVFTSGTKDYAETILNIIEQKNNSRYFDGILYREHTTIIGKKYIKDLSKIGRDLSKTIIVDNLPQSFKLQRENGILINSFYGDNMDDRALFELKRILINIYKEKADVRDSIIKYKEDIIKNETLLDENDCRYKNK